MIKCMSKSFASYIISIYNNPNDPRSPARLAERKQRGDVGKNLARQALSGNTGKDAALDSLFRTVRLLAETTRDARACMIEPQPWKVVAWMFKCPYMHRPAGPLKCLHGGRVCVHTGTCAGGQIGRRRAGPQRVCRLPEAVP